MVLFLYLILADDKDSPSLQDLKTLLEKNSDEIKIDTMKKILIIMLSGDSLPGILMHVIRFIMPAKNKELKKLLLIYWEICPKLDANGKLKQEMVLVCNALRNDLLHPNEFIRGNTLRYLCKLRESEILEPLIPTVRACLDHKHPYVRKHAVFAVYTIFKTFEHLIPDACELIDNFLNHESDTNAKRNAFTMLLNCQPAKAVLYFHSVYHQIPTLDSYFQLSMIELIRKDCKSPTADKAKYIQCIFSLLHSSHHSVKYEAANTLIALTSNPTAIKAAATCYIELIIKESDNNVKLIVLDRLSDLQEKNQRIMDDLVMDILRVLSSPDIDVRKKAIEIALEMISSRNVLEVVTFLKKELLKTHEREYEKNNQYRQLLIQAIHNCAINFSEVTDSVVHVLMDFISDSASSSAVDVISFVREVMEKFPDLRESIISRLLDTFGDIKTGRVFRGALWIIGEYALAESSINEGLVKIRDSIGELPILESEKRAKEEALDGIDRSQMSPTMSQQAPHKRVLADGTYASETAFVSKGSPISVVSGMNSKTPLRSLIITGDYFLASVLATCLTKLALRYSELLPNSVKTNAIKTEAMLIMTSIIRVGKSEFSVSKIDEDSQDRLMTCLRVLSSPVNSSIKSVFLEKGRGAFAVLIQAKDINKSKKKKSTSVVQVDDLIKFRQLKSKKIIGSAEDEYELDLNRATGFDQQDDSFSTRLDHIRPLTGYSDPVYVEAYVNVHQYDIMLDILIVNQTSETLQNLTVEFSTLGDLKLVERPASQTIGAHGFHSIKASIKVSSTETGVVFGHVMYEGTSALDMKYVTLNEIHVDIMDYIKPEMCNETQFRMMWTEFEWENKVNVNSRGNNIRKYLDELMKSTNMACLTPEHALLGDCGFLAANLYARSLFGEDALANVSLEQLEEDKIVGHVRIRSKTQGIALSLGDKITLAQKKR